MIILASGIVQAKLDGERILLNVESGETELSLSLSVHQATWLAVALADTINDALVSTPAMTADVLPFSKKFRRKPD